MIGEGFEVVCEVARDNERARQDEYAKLADALTARREGIPLELWRSLPDAED
ncbi:hypothetical protein [Streptomyces sp. NPDC046939]|uniref:hypothetical protein n=1 Tax=Streptomyces sp. NPDC046939 TaxID=3155376 RepID=UPI00340F17FD